MTDGVVPRPTALPVLPDGIPAALIMLDRWVIWQYTWKQEKGKWDKPPRTLAGGYASATRPTDWCSYEQAIAATRERGFDGVGFVFICEDDLIGIDLDDCRDQWTGQLLPWTADQRGSLPPEFPEPDAIVRSLGSYVEVSPSGTGVKAIVRASVPKAARG